MARARLTPMRHLIERVLSLQDDEEIVPLPPVVDEEKLESNDDELRNLLESLKPRIRVYGVGGAGCNAIGRLQGETRKSWRF